MQSTVNSAWTAPTTMRRHTGTPIPIGLSFFIRPPSEIGELYSADSNVKEDSKAASSKKQGVVITAAVCGAIALFLYFVFESLWPVVLTGILAIMVIWAILFAQKYTCSFVGNLGFTKGVIPQSNKSKPQIETFLFENAIALHTSQTQNYLNGVYAGTSYKYEWKLPANKKYTLIGEYRSKESRPPEGDPFYLAVAAENAWTQHLLPLAIEDLETKGSVSFPMSGKLQMIRISEGALEFILKNGESQITRSEDMKNISLAQGMFSFQHKDTKWWSGKGKYSFAYQNIPNAKLFLICLERIAGISFG